ncbi:2'-5' RNA ligase family protein [Cytophagaceae bacterium YF14B1]|uniref:2'-5' RNA ligase family protein n=1 Tax=Xanthocytophaga flava TaxID=3048013 RepID=A0AAE3U9I1_9BACT|nr:2'-5' RNA ligase family protein [Xanthocytophaga flavus]MDJ1485129.1 2'-5' RNA ligase family protein [Xanthocytophaga flavus]
MVSKRLQLTLFVDETVSQTIEKVRHQFNPEQYNLIKAHVTLCREDELKDLTQVYKNLNSLKFSGIEIRFGQPVRFAEGKGVFLPAEGENETFYTLRKYILQDEIRELKHPEPHITLMHPRNSTCTDELFTQIMTFSFPQSILFTRISLIEQLDGKEWKVIKEFIF